MSFTESKINEQRDDTSNQIANIDTLANWSIEAAAQRKVIAGEIFELIYSVSKNGIIQDTIKADISVSGNLTIIDDIHIQAGENGHGIITISANGVTFNQRVSIGDVEAITPVITGSSKIRVSDSAQYDVDYTHTVEFKIDNEKLASIKTIDNNSCIVQANSNNKLGTVILTAKCGEIVLEKQIKIVSLW